jgi:hypothetical protein
VVALGFGLQAEPVVSADRRYVTLGVRARQCDLIKMEDRPYPNAPADEQIVTQVPHVGRWDLTATCSVPDKGTLLAADLQYSVVPAEPNPFGGGPGKRCILMLKPTIIVPAEVESANARLPTLLREPRACDARTGG